MAPSIEQTAALIAAEHREGKGFHTFEGLPDLATAEADGLEHREVAPSASYRGAQRVADGEDRQCRDERGEDERVPGDLAQPRDLDGRQVDPRRHSRGATISYMRGTYLSSA